MNKSALVTIAKSLGIVIVLLFIFEVFCFYQIKNSKRIVKIQGNPKLEMYLPLLKHSKLNEEDLIKHFNNIKSLQNINNGAREYHPYLIYNLKPNLRSETFWTNSYGLLDDEPDFSKKQILLLGSSVTGGGMRQNLGENIDHYLENLIEKKIGSKKYEVLNAGVGGYSSPQEFIMMHLLFDKINFDKIIYFSGANDIDSRYRVVNHDNLRSFDSIHSRMIKSQIEQNKLLRKNPIISLYTYVKNYFLRSLYSYQYLSRIVSNKMVYRNKPIKEEALTAKDNSHIDEIVKGYLSNVEKMIILAKSKNIELYVGIQPIALDKNFRTKDEEKNLNIILNSYGYKYKLYFNKAYPQMRKGLNILKKKYPENLIILNTKTVFDKTKIDIYRDNVHFLEYANEIVAKKIFDKLKFTEK
tara:strand:+ start:6462 stop:7697 length:1236 start_codon:yes stop_codon:yes gene_type:complete